MARRGRKSTNASDPNKLAKDLLMQDLRAAVRRKIAAESQDVLVDRETDRVMAAIERETNTARVVPVAASTPSASTANGLDRKPGWQAREARRLKREKAATAAGANA